MAPRSSDMLAALLVPSLALLPATETAPRAARVAPHARAGVLRMQGGGVYRARLKSPMGIVFEEVQPGEAEGWGVAALVGGRAS